MQNERKCTVLLLTRREIFIVTFFRFVRSILRKRCVPVTEKVLNCACFQGNVKLFFAPFEIDVKSELFSSQIRHKTNL